MLVPNRLAQTADPYLWLEDITGPRALDWVKQQDARTVARLESWPDFQPLRTRLLGALDSEDRIPFIAKYGKFYYNFWRDKEHPRGLWRRTTLDEYKKPDPAWETVLDLDQLAASEKVSWVWRGEVLRKPEYDRCLIILSRGGADAHVVREFDLNKKEFVPNGFSLPEAKSDVSWRDLDSIYVDTDFGPGSLTESGYPRIVKLWKRGTPLADAKTEFVANADDVGVSAEVEHDHGYVYEFIDRSIADFQDEMFLRRGDDWVRIDKPLDAQLDTFGKYLLLDIRSDWTVAGQTYRAGSLLAEPLEDYLRGDRHLSVLFQPEPRTSLLGWSDTKNDLILNELNNVCGRAEFVRPNGEQWVHTPIPVPPFGSIDISGVDDNESDDYFLIEEDWLSPPTLSLGTCGQDNREQLKSMPAVFDASNLQAVQYEAISKDGTHIPYFLVGPKDMKLDGTNPTLLYGYGGFEISITPEYREDVGIGWLERGGSSPWRIFAAGGNSAPPGTKPPNARNGKTPMTISRPWLKTSSIEKSPLPNIWASKGVPTAGSSSASCSRSDPISSAPSSVNRPFWTCAATPSSSPGRAGSMNTGTPTTPPIGRSSAAILPIRMFARIARIPLCFSRLPRVTTAFIQAMPERWPLSWKPRGTTSSFMKTPKAATAAARIMPIPPTRRLSATRSFGRNSNRRPIKLSRLTKVLAHSSSNLSLTAHRSADYYRP